MASIPGGVPDVNDLVRVSLGSLDDPDVESRASDIPSRIEDVDHGPPPDPDAGRPAWRLIGRSPEPVRPGPVAYVIAAPRFSGNLELPLPDAPCSLQWPTPRGVCLLPAAFEHQETTETGLRTWRVRITGPLRREERRQFVRITWALETHLLVPHDLSHLDAARQRQLYSMGVAQALPELPPELPARALNVSEGGLLCMSTGPILPALLPLIAEFTIEETDFTIPAHVVWSSARTVKGAPKGEVSVESALAFDDPTINGEELRPLLFQAQLQARRTQLETARQ